MVIQEQKVYDLTFVTTLNCSSKNKKICMEPIPGFTTFIKFTKIGSRKIDRCLEFITPENINRKIINMGNTIWMEIDIPFTMNLQIKLIICRVNIRDIFTTDYGTCINLGFKTYKFSIVPGCVPPICFPNSKSLKERENKATSKEIIEIASGKAYRPDLLE